VSILFAKGCKITLFMPASNFYNVVISK